MSERGLEDSVSSSSSKASKRASQGKPGRSKVKKTLSGAEIKERRKSLSDASHLVVRMDSGAVSEDESASKRKSRTIHRQRPSNSTQNSAAIQPAAASPATLNKKVQGNLVFEEGSPVVKGGAINDLAKWLLDCGDKEVILSFLIGFRQHWRHDQLFELVQQRFRQSKKDSSPQGSRDLFGTLDFLNIWLDNYLVRDFMVTNHMRSLDMFLSEIKGAGFVDYANRLKLLMIRRQEQRLLTQPFRLWDSKARATTPKISKKSKESTKIPENGVVKFADISTQDFAEQMTQYEFDLFKTIEDKCSLSRMIEHFNKVSIWVASEILQIADIKERANTVKKMIAIAERCQELNSFNLLMELTAGLNMTAVQRLSKTWLIVPGPARASFERMTRLMTTKNNFQTYRTAAQAAKRPVVPYIGVYCRDFTFIEEGNPDKLDNGFVNFDKIHLNGKVLIDVHRMQKGAYHYKIHPKIGEYFKSLVTLSEDELFSRSYQLEPEDAPTNV